MNDKQGSSPIQGQILYSRLREGVASFNTQKPTQRVKKKEKKERKERN